MSKKPSIFNHICKTAWYFTGIPLFKSIISAVKRKNFIILIPLGLFIIVISSTLILPENPIIVIAQILVGVIIIAFMINFTATYAFEYFNGRLPTKKEKTLFIVCFALIAPLLLGFALLNVKYHTTPFWIFVRTVIFCGLLILLYKIIQHLIFREKSK